MRRQWFEVELLSEVAIGSGNTLQGPAMTLDYLSGNLFLGTAAAALYRDAAIQPDRTFHLFHSGQVRFSDAWPLAPSGAPAWPVPRCWQRPKAERFRDEKNNLLLADAIDNALSESSQGGLKSLKDGYVSRFGEDVLPATRMRLKTAIDFKTGWSADARIFGYASLARGLRFACFIEADEPDEKTWRALLKALTGDRRLGRSRSAEYGRTRIRPIEEPAAWTSERPESKFTYLWLLSDMAAEDEWGAPTALPAPEVLGLPPGRVVPEKCFTATRRDAPFNGHYRAHEQERLLICRGSVLTYALESRDALDDSPPIGWGGLYQQSGLGCFWIDPPLLTVDPVRFVPPPPALQSQPKKSKTLQPPDLPLARWLDRWREDQDRERESRAKSEEWFRALRGLYRSAQTLAGEPEDVCIGPSPSQWGRIEVMANHWIQDGTSDPARIRAALFGGDKAPCREGDEDWTRQVLDVSKHRGNAAPITFRIWLDDALSGDLKSPAETLALLARAGRDAAKLASEPEREEASHDA